MKKILNSFYISDYKIIELYIPDNSNKFNYYYEVSEKLNSFDKIAIDLCLGVQRINLYEDALGGSLLNWSAQIKGALNKTIELPQILEVGQVCYALNKSEMTDEYKEINFHEYWVWASIHGAQTFMYTHNTCIYLEIGLIYPWLYRDKDISDPNYISYEKFMTQYHVVLIQEISKAQAKQWLDSCTMLLKELDLPF